MMNKKELFFSIGKNIVFAFPPALLLSILMSIGQIIQPVFTKFFTSESVKLYDMLNEGTITINQASFVDWITAYFWPWYLILSLLCILIAVKGRTPKKIFLYLSILIFLSLMITDLIFCDLKTQLLINFVSNLIGSPIIAVIILLSLDAGNTINRFFENKSVFLQYVVNTVLSIGLGFLIAFITYLIDRNIYAVTSSKIDLLAKFPARGAFGIDTNNTVTSFSTNQIKHVFWMGLGKNFSLNWQQNNHTNIYKVDIRVIDGLPIDKKDVMTRAIATSPTYSIDHADKLFLTTNDGVMNMYIIENSSDGGTVTTFQKQKIHIETFDVKKIKNNTFYLSRYLLSPTQIKHSTGANSISYVLTFLDSDNSGNTLKNRKINLQVGNKKIEIHLIANNKPNDQSNYEVLPKSNNEIYYLKGETGGIVLTIQKIKEDNTVAQNFNEILINGFNGDMNINGINRYELSEFFGSHSLKLLDLDADVKKLYIDGNEYNQGISSSRIYLNKGDITGKITDEGYIRFTGDAYAIYEDGNRINLSRWERIEMQYKMLIGGLLSGVFIFFYRRLKLIFGENQLLI